MDLTQHTTTLPGTSVSVGDARDFVAAVLGPAHPCLSDALLLVSELATNAVLHTLSGRGGTYEVLVAGDVGTVRVEVHDLGGGSAPCTPATDDGMGEHGRGVEMMSTLASRWAYEPYGNGLSVWFELTTGRDLVGAC